MRWAACDLFCSTRSNFLILTRYLISVKLKFYFYTILLALLVSSSIFAQDIIVRKNGEEITCEITRVDSVKVYFDVYRGRLLRSTFLAKDEIASMRYHSQNYPWMNNSDIASLGIGLGLDLGVLGANLIIYPQRNVGVFGGFAYVLIGTGYNVGIKLRGIRKSTQNRVIPYAIGMYGFQTAVVIVNETKLNRTFNGFTAGAGFDFRRKSKSLGYWSFSLFYPFRGDAAFNYINDLKTKNKKFKNELRPLSFGISYKLILNFWK